MRALLLLLLGPSGCALPALALKAHEADEGKLLETQVIVKGGAFKFGATVEVGPELAGSGSAKRAKVKSFAIDATAVTNEQFRRFTRDTKYKTEAETFAWSFVHEYLITKKTLAHADKEDGLGRVKDTPHWVAVEGAYWRRPEGPDSNMKGRADHPAAHISYNDAKAYCQWANGRRLPTEKEWEYAARGNHDDEPFPWGETAEADDMNGWQGNFPKENTAQDGWVGTAPVKAYSKPNPYGMHNMLGNVWEWCEGGEKEKRPLRGGSYVDTLDGSHNHPLRVWTRMENSPDSGSHNTGFRCASGAGHGKHNEEEPPKYEPPKPRKKASDLDQEELQRVLAERGADGLNEWLQEQGVGGQVMTPAQLKQKQADLKAMRAQLEKEGGMGPADRGAEL